MNKTKLFRNCDCVKLGRSVTIGRGVCFEGGEIELGDNCVIEDGVTVHATDYFSLGERGRICGGTRIAGRSVIIGSDFWGSNFVVGGGSCFEKKAFFECGRFCHLGEHSFINIARPVTLGEEVGVGMYTRIFTHGAYLSPFSGFPCKFAPVKIGDRVWLPNAVILPGVEIGSDVVVAASSVVNTSIPSGSFAGGIPATVLKKNAFPRKISPNEEKRLFEWLLDDLIAGTRFGSSLKTKKRCKDFVVFSCGAKTRRKELRCRKEQHEERELIISLRDDVSPSSGQTVFSIRRKSLSGVCDAESENLRNILRRAGIRFKNVCVKNRYEVGLGHLGHH